jgi:hypothetical protein
MLHLPETVRAAAVKIDTGIPDPDHGVLSHLYRFHMNALVLGAVYGPVQEVPEDERQQVLIRTDFNISIYLIDNYSLTTYCTRKKTRHQFVYKTMEGYGSVTISSHSYRILVRGLSFVV